MHTYIMSDIHGHYTEFQKMLKKIKFDESDMLYIIGDIIDRGSDNLKMLDYVMNHKNIQLLMGNHEDMFLHSYRDLSKIDKKWYTKMWLYNGGDKTQDELYNISEEKIEKYLDYIEHLPLYQFIHVNEKDYLLVHAGLRWFNQENIDRDLFMKKQVSEDLLWIRDEFFQYSFKNFTTADKNNNLIIIFGHTPTAAFMSYFPDLTENQKKRSLTNKIIKFKNRIGIDCGCSSNRNLGCLRLDDMKEFYVKCEE